MPLLPTNIGKVPPKESCRLEAGAIVEYEHSGKPLLGVLIGEKKNKWSILNQRGREAEFQANRLYLLPGRIPADITENSQKAAYLEKLAEDAIAKAAAIDLASLWEVLADETKETTVTELTELEFNADSTVNRLAIRRALLTDLIYFKRRKTGFEPRGASIVEELKLKAEAESKKEAKREAFIGAFLARLDDTNSPLPQPINPLEQFAALGMNATEAKEALYLVDQIIARASLDIHGRPENRAFQLLVRAKHFNENENIWIHRYQKTTTFPDDVCVETKQLVNSFKPLDESNRRDLRNVFTVSIDSETTRDIDDALSCEKTERGIRIGVHISDVASVILPGSLLEIEAFHRATSIYCPDVQLSMFPQTISEGILSLVEGEPRLVLSSFVELDENGAILDRAICHSLVQIDKRLSYDDADNLIFDETPANASAEDHGAATMLLSLWDAVAQLEETRQERGALSFSRRDLFPLIQSDNQIILEDMSDSQPSRKLVGELMILANETAALFAEKNNFPLVFRSQEAPEVDISEQGLDIPEGAARGFHQRGFLKRSSISTEPGLHSALGLQAYAQTTSPIRRAVDLLNQRQIGTYLTSGSALYSAEQVLEILGSFQSGLEAAILIQKESVRYWTLKYIQQNKIKELEGTIIKVSSSKPLAELELLGIIQSFHSRAPAGAKKGAATVASSRLGERIRLKITDINPRKEVFVLSETD